MKLGIDPKLLAGAKDGTQVIEVRDEETGEIHRMRLKKKKKEKKLH